MLIVGVDVSAERSQRVPWLAVGRGGGLHGGAEPAEGLAVRAHMPVAVRRCAGSPPSGGDRRWADRLQKAGGQSQQLLVLRAGEALAGHQPIFWQAG